MFGRSTSCNTSLLGILVVFAASLEGCTKSVAPSSVAHSDVPLHPEDTLQQYLREANTGEVTNPREFAKLLAERGAVRLQWLDPGALEDFRWAARLGHPVAAKTLDTAVILAAGSALRHSSHFEWKRGRALLQTVSTPTNQLYATYDEYDGKTLQELERIFYWFEGLGAKRQALKSAEAFVKGGGRKVSILKQWVELHHWWYGSTRALLPSDAASLVAPRSSPLARFKIAIQEGGGGDGHRIASGRQEYEIQQLVALAQKAYSTGDSALARRHLMRLANRYPGRPCHWLAAGVGASAEGDPLAGLSYFTKAAAASGDPGRYWSMAATVLRDDGHLLAALQGFRHALRLSSEGEDMGILWNIGRVQSALQRDADAKQTFATLWSRFAPGNRDAAKSLVARHRSRVSGARSRLLTGCISDPKF